MSLLLRTVRIANGLFASSAVSILRRKPKPNNNARKQHKGAKEYDDRKDGFDHDCLTISRSRRIRLVFLTVRINLRCKLVMSSYPSEFDQPPTVAEREYEYHADFNPVPSPRSLKILEGQRLRITSAARSRDNACRPL